MTTIEQFRECFVSEKGYDSLKKLMKNGTELSNDIAETWQERCNIEIAYAKGLRKCNETFLKLANRAKGSLVQGLTTIANQTNAESEAHNLLANTLSTKICIPMKNLADTQSKARKPIEVLLNDKFKVWKEKKDADNKYRQRQFENCKDIESLYLKMDEIPKTTKNSVKEVSKTITTNSALSSKQMFTIEMSLRKAEQELEKTEKKYHDATKEVELARQACDAEMCRSCDQMQMMELDRIVETEKFIQTYANAIQILSESMNQIKQELQAIHITPQEDIITEARANIQTTETEILLYDIYAENEHHAMSQERRVLSLMRWIQMLKQDIDIQHRSKDGIENLQGFCKQNQKFSSTVNSGDITVNRQSVRLLLCLYEGSLYKMERIYNQLKRQPEPYYEHSQRYAKSSTDKGISLTFLRIPFQPLASSSCSTPAMSVLARSTPVAAPAPLPPPYPTATATQAAPIGWNIGSESSSDLYPMHTLSTASNDSFRQQIVKHVRVLHSYDAEHDDELTIRQGDIIVLLERRSDQWYRGNLNGQIGLFPGNYVKDC